MSNASAQPEGDHFWFSCLMKILFGKFVCQETKKFVAMQMLEICHSQIWQKIWAAPLKKNKHDIDMMPSPHVGPDSQRAMINPIGNNYVSKVNTMLQFSQWVSEELPCWYWYQVAGFWRLIWTNWVRVGDVCCVVLLFGSFHNTWFKQVFCLFVFMPDTAQKRPPVWAEVIWHCKKKSKTIMFLLPVISVSPDNKKTLNNGNPVLVSSSAPHVLSWGEESKVCPWRSLLGLSVHWNEMVGVKDTAISSEQCGAAHTSAAAAPLMLTNGEIYYSYQ